MLEGGFFDYVSMVLYLISEVLLIPVMVVLILFILLSLFNVGALIVEVFAENRHFKVNSPNIINAIHDSEYSRLANVVNEGKLLKPQRNALNTVIQNMGLDEDELYALARIQIENVSDRYKRILSMSEQVTKIAPMLGLMSTLIPLGPGLVALGKGDVMALSQSLLVAFNGTVAGLVAAVVCMVVTVIRKRWYTKYTVILESLMTAILSKADAVKKQGVKLPTATHEIMEPTKPKREKKQKEV